MSLPLYLMNFLNQSVGNNKQLYMKQVIVPKEYKELLETEFKENPRLKMKIQIQLEILKHLGVCFEPLKYAIHKNDVWVLLESPCYTLCVNWAQALWKIKNAIKFFTEQKIWTWIEKEAEDIIQTDFGRWIENIWNLFENSIPTLVGNCYIVSTKQKIQSLNIVNSKSKRDQDLDDLKTKEESIEVLDLFNNLRKMCIFFCILFEEGSTEHKKLK